MSSRPHKAESTGLSPLSLTLRLLFLFVLAVALLLAGISGFFYARLNAHLDAEHRHLLQEVGLWLAGFTADELAARAQGEGSWKEEGDLFVPSRYGFRLSDRQGAVRAQTPSLAAVAPELPWSSLTATPLLKASLPEGRMVLLLQRPHPEGQLVVVLDITEDEALLAQLRRGLWLASLAALAAASASGFWFVRRGLRPLTQLAQRVADLGAAELKERLEPESFPQELVPLVEAFNQLLARLEKAFLDVATSSANLAHQLRTPLARLQGAVEVALLAPRSAEEYRQVLQSALEELQDLARLADKLLFLTRADRSELALACRECSLAEEVGKVVELYRALAESQGVTLVMEGSARAWVDPQLVQQAVANLLANALRAAPEGVVRVGLAEDSAVARITVSDNGCGMDPQLAAAFAGNGLPWGRPGAQGHGLGLAVVRAIVRAHGGEVGITSQPGRGTSVTLSFPRLRAHVQDVTKK